MVTKDTILNNASKIQSISRRTVQYARQFPTFIFVTTITDSGKVKCHVYASKADLQKDYSLFGSDIKILDIFNYSTLSGEVWNFNERMINYDFNHYLSVCIADRF